MQAGRRYTRRDFFGIAASGCACVACGGANAQTLRYDLKAVEIAPQSYAVYGAQEYFTFQNGGNIVNTAFFGVPDGVVVVDTGPSRRYGEAFQELIAATLPGRDVVRVFNTHHHPDHFFGNQVFDRGLIAAPQTVIDNIDVDGVAFADNLYRLVGDWMRGTEPVAPGLVIDMDREDVGGRALSYLRLAGHTSADFALRDDATGVLYAGDLAFLDRAPTTPHADLDIWRASLRTLLATDRDVLLPGHGPADPKNDAILQTLDYLDWLDGSLRDAVQKGLTMTEAMAVPIPDRFAALGVVRSEFERSVVHLFERFEDELYESVPVAD
ncbi:MAG: quinoprotein relay system zinc metallohydrolase 1 [Pseudomonadota bacterium]